jgi:hypothetical protein
MSQQGTLPLPVVDSRLEWLGDRCCLQCEGDLCIVTIGGAPLLRFPVGDRLQERMAATLIVESRAAKVNAVQKAFALDDVTLWRARKRFREGGLAALMPARRDPRGPSKVFPAVVRRLVELRRKGFSQREIAERLGVSRRTVRDVLAREGEAIPRPTAQTRSLPLEPAVAEGTRDAMASEPASGQAVPSPMEAGSPAAVEAVEEASPCAASARAQSAEIAALYAMLGLSRDGEAEVVFESRRAVPFAGVLLAVPLLTATGLLEAARAVYGRLRSGVYGLRATMLVLFVLALLRRPRPEALKGTDPQGLGDVMGLLRAPEVKTVRRKLAEIARVGRAHELLRTLAQRWMREREDVLGVLYVDGHVRVYNGKHRLPKARVAQRNLCLPATTDYWVNDVDGDPVFVVTGRANPALTQVLADLLGEMEELGGGRRGTVIFDRGGWSPKLFRRLIGRGWHVLTYRKGKRRPHRRGGFVEQRQRIDGREVSYTLSEKVVRFRGGLKLREIGVLRKDGEQTILVTSHFTPAAILLAYRMFGRWRQENYFRYMMENFAMDALVDYEVEADDPNREVPNPARKQVHKQLEAALGEAAELERRYGAAAADNVESKRPTMRGFKISHGALGQALRHARERVEMLKTTLKETTQRVPIGTVVGSDQVVRLSQERKLFTDGIKAATYRAESGLLQLVRPHFKRAEDEGRAFLRNAVQLSGDLLVEGDRVIVRFAPMSALRFTTALGHLCEALNAMEPRFPETSYRLRYEVAAAPGPG